MLEKIGLPAKPSLRGNNWVVDASHCQGCSSQFTFINRKHHCRRCGGLFCNSCTQQRMVLRGQGDSPVRICDPCKKLEEAARYEMRYGHKNRSGKATSKVASRSADEVLNELLVGNSRDASSSEVAVQGEENFGGDELSGVHNELSSSSPEELRQQALEEKSKYKTLKGEGKSSEALKAFKRAKELERQAAALELQLRKNRRKALASSSSMGQSENSDDSPPEVSKKIKPSVQKGKGKDDLTAELKALGWSEMDLDKAEKKPAPTTLESELFNLMGDTSAETGHNKRAGGIDRMEVVALKKKALMLKREGKLAEAKEELKKAKILERQLEEQEFLADAEESDDEISALIRSMDDDKHDDLSMGYMDSGFDFDKLVGDAGDLDVGGVFEVSNDDMDDPDLVATLKSLGWTEEPDQPVKVISQPIPVEKDQIKQELLSLKKEAIIQKRSGNVVEAMSLLKKAKLLEKDLEGFESQNLAPSEKESDLEAVEARSSKARSNLELKQAPKSRLMIQKELLALKKKALALRREGKVDEAEDELKKGKILEQQLEDMDNAQKKKGGHAESRHEVSESSNQHLDVSTALPSFDEGEEDITEQDMNDPTYLTLLRNMGWQDEDNEVTLPKSSERNDASTPQIGHEVGKIKTKAEIQRELLGIKRKALALRHQGQSSEADKMLQTAKVLESKLAEMEATVKEDHVGSTEHADEVKVTKDEVISDTLLPTEDRNAETTFERPPEVKDVQEKRIEMAGSADAEAISSQDRFVNSQSSPQQEILSHKRKALTLKREGKLAEAREELRRAKLLEKALEEDKSQGVPSSSTAEASTPSPTSSVPSTVQEELSPPNVAPKPMSSHERFKLQRECLNHKRNSLKLRREGRVEEADAELQIAKNLEAQLEEASAQSPGESSKEVGTTGDVGIEDLLDPQIMSALKAIGLHDVQDTPQVLNKTQPIQQPTSSPQKGGSSSQERVQLEAQIKAEKVKALNLKRSGKQAEALDALRRAKQLEKKLSVLPS